MTKISANVKILNNFAFQKPVSSNFMNIEGNYEISKKEKNAFLSNFSDFDENFQFDPKFLF